MKLVAKLVVVGGASAGLLVLSAASASAASLPKPKFDASGNLVPVAGATEVTTGFLCGTLYKGKGYLSVNSWAGYANGAEYLQCAAESGQRGRVKTPVVVLEGTSGCGLPSGETSTLYKETIDRKGTLVLTCARTVPVES